MNISKLITFFDDINKLSTTIDKIVRTQIESNWGIGWPPTKKGGPLLGSLREYSRKQKTTITGTSIYVVFDGPFYGRYQHYGTKYIKARPYFSLYDEGQIIDYIKREIENVL